MARVRRTEFLFVCWRDGSFLDIAALLQGVVRPAPLRQIYAISILAGEEVVLSADELALLTSVPSDEWVSDDGDAALGDLARRGLLVSDDPDPSLAELRKRDEQLSASGWNLYGALYHSMTRWRDLDLHVELAAGGATHGVAAPVGDFVDEFGPPPPPFHTVTNGRATLELPLVRRDGGLYDALAKRTTTRSFEPGSSVALDDLATLLYYAFGCHGYAPMLEDVYALRKTSPSGGSLHPIEVYPLVLSVDGLEPGLYHYAVERHSLEPMTALGSEEAAELAGLFTCGQTYFRGASVLFVLAARFYRSFWKYRRHERAYAVVLMDAAHLSQTLYLVAAELGLGAFFTAAINTENVDEQLGLDGFGEGTVAICGCGKIRRDAAPVFRPFVPRKTRL